MRRNEITYVNNNVHNNPHLLSALLKTTLHTFSLRWHGAWHTINTRVAQKQNPKALQENPAQQATEGRTRGCGLPPVRLHCRPTPPEPERGPTRVSWSDQLRNRICVTSHKCCDCPNSHPSSASSRVTEWLCGCLCRRLCLSLPMSVCLCAYVHGTLGPVQACV